MPLRGMARIVRTLEVISSPVVPSPRVAACTNTPFSSENAHREAVELKLAAVR